MSAKGKKKQQQQQQEKQVLQQSKGKPIFSIILVISMLGIAFSFASFHFLNKKSEKTDIQESDGKVYQLKKANSNYNYRIKKIYEQDMDKFTQGFGFFNSTTILECTGVNGQSFVHLVDRKTMKTLKKSPISSEHFGEGCEFIDVVNAETKQSERLIYYLTWQSKKALVFNDNLELIKTIDFPKEIKEGWGLTKYFDEKANKMFFLMTDGSEKVYFLDVETFQVEKIIQVQQNLKGNHYIVRNLNEIEIYKDNTALVNVFMTQNIVQINLEDGKVLQKYDMKFLNDQIDLKTGIKNYFKQGYGQCLNGIAYDQTNNQLLLTGKKWPLVFEVEFFENSKIKN